MVREADTSLVPDRDADALTDWLRVHDRVCNMVRVPLFETEAAVGEQVPDSVRDHDPGDSVALALRLRVWLKERVRVPESVRASEPVGDCVVEGADGVGVTGRVGLRLTVADGGLGERLCDPLGGVSVTSLDSVGEMVGEGELVGVRESLRVADQT